MSGTKLELENLAKERNYETELKIKNNIKATIISSIQKSEYKKITQDSPNITNGMTGTIKIIDENTLEFTYNNKHKYLLYKSTVSENKFLTTDNEIEIISFKQFPIRPAWASTIHKAQGQTIESFAIDFDSFWFGAENLGYVALSRAPRLENITLINKIKNPNVLKVSDLSIKIKRDIYQKAKITRENYSNTYQDILDNAEEVLQNRINKNLLLLK